MQRITVKEVHPPTGENKPTVIVAADGARMSGFLPALKDLLPNAIIEAELEVKGKYTNITDFKVISEGHPSPSEGEGNDMTPDMWAEKDRIKTSSIETQNAYTGVPGLVELIHKYPDDPLANAAYNYAMFKLGNRFSQGVSSEPTESTTSTTEEKTQRKTNGRDLTALKTIIDMQKACHADFGIQPADLLKELNINSWAELTLTPAEVYQTISATH